MIAHAGKILHAAAAHEHDRVLLQIVADAGNVSCNFNTIGQAGAGDLAQSGVRLLRRLRVNANAYASLFRTSLQRG